MPDENVEYYEYLLRVSCARARAEGGMTCPHCKKGTWVDSNGTARRCYACRGTGSIVAPAPTAALSPTGPSGPEEKL